MIGVSCSGKAPGSQDRGWHQRVDSLNLTQRQSGKQGGMNPRGVASPLFEGKRCTPASRGGEEEKIVLQGAKNANTGSDGSLRGKESTPLAFNGDESM